MIVSTPIVLHALGSCADILSKDWDIDTYCQDPEWKEVMVLWKSKQLHASVREVDEDGLDADNSPFLKLSLDETIQAVRDTLEGGRPSRRYRSSRKNPTNEGSSGGKPHPME
jgi:hypothetical protein